MSVTRLVYEIDTGGKHFIDLAKDLSIINRKLIRQKQIFTVMGGLMKDSEGADLSFRVAPHTWTTKLAINRAFKQWRKVQSATLKQSPGLRSSKWNDFKVLLNNDHEDRYTLTPMYSTGVPHSEGEWDYSTLTQPKLIDVGGGALGFDADADQWDMHIVGSHVGTGSETTADGRLLYTNYSRIGLISSWYHSRPLPRTTDPSNVPVGANEGQSIYTDPLSNLLSVNDDDNEQAEIIETENDIPPYSLQNVQGCFNGQTQLVSFCDNTAGEPDVVTVPGFQAICGLIEVDVTSTDGLYLILDVQTEGERF
jgi:hypothetical protein